MRCCAKAVPLCARIRFCPVTLRRVGHFISPKYYFTTSNKKLGVYRKETYPTSSILLLHRQPTQITFPLHLLPSLLLSCFLPPTNHNKFEALVIFSLAKNSDATTPLSQLVPLSFNSFLHDGNFSSFPCPSWTIPLRGKIIFFCPNGRFQRNHFFRSYACYNS